MTFDEMLDEAEKAAKGQNALSRLVGGSHNIVRQWKMGMSLPSTPTQEAALAKLIGRSPEEVHEIIWREHRRRWEAKRSADRRLFATKPPQKVTRRPPPARLRRQFA